MHANMWHVYVLSFTYVPSRKYDNMLCPLHGSSKMCPESGWRSKLYYTHFLAKVFLYNLYLLTKKYLGSPTMQKAYFFGKVGQTSQCSWGQNLNEHQFWAPFRYFLLLAVTIFNIFEWSLKASKLSVKMAQNILVQICLKWLYINTLS